MLLSHLKRLCIFTATLIAASPLATVVSTPSSLPGALQQSVPSCAQSCLQAALAEKFAVACFGQESIQCICSRYSNSGESLGEVALGCVYSSCSMADKAAGSAYNVCLGQRNAVLPTKTALTVVATNVPRTSSSTPPRTTATPAITTTFLSAVVPSQSVVVDSIQDAPSATASALTSPSASTTSTALPVTAQAPRNMTPAQIAGLSVAAVAAFIIAIGLMAMSVCLRRRRERKDQFVSDEKSLGRKSRKYSTRVSHYVTVGSVREPPRRFPMAPLPVARTADKGAKSKKYHPAPLYSTRPVQNNGVGTSNNSSDTSISLSQIGVAISAELDGNPAPPRNVTNAPTQQNLLHPGPTHLGVPTRPFSTMTQETVFEEDEAAAHRRSSVLLPIPPAPIPPIRSLQPSKRAATFDTATGPSVPPTQVKRHTARRSELFLEIPVRHERPQPKRLIANHLPSTGSPKQLPSTQTNRLAPPLRNISSSSPHATPASSHPGDIDDYYFSSYPTAAPRVRPKRSGSTVSRTPSLTSTPPRSSRSSQTSFETADPSTPTPDSSDKQLSDENEKLSPVAESPISHLRYPKVPRASNQLVPRSPRSPPAARSPPLLRNRHKDLAPLLLETRVPLRFNAPRLGDPFTSPHRRAQSGQTSPSAYSDDVVAPLNVRRTRELVGVREDRDTHRRRSEMAEINIGRDVCVHGEGLASPVWVPRLTPSRKGEDLFISVGWGGR